MNTESDNTLRDSTLAVWTGHSPRYLRVRRAVRAIVATAPILIAFIHALAPTR